MRKSKDFIKEYAEQRDRIKKRFEVERTGDQLQYIDQTKLFKPLLETQKGIQEKIVSGQDTLSSALTPLANEMRKRNEPVDDLVSLFHDPHEIEDGPAAHSTPKQKDNVFLYNLDGVLNDSDRINLVDMSLQLPSEVYMEENYESVLKKIETLNRQYGQLTRKRSKEDEKMKDMYNSRKTTLQKYKRTLLEQKPAMRYKLGHGLRKRTLCKPKRNRGRPRIYPDTIVYSSVNDLCQKLNELVAAKGAGNTGLDNTINAVLDELLNTSAIDKDTYNNLFRNIFHNI